MKKIALTLACIIPALLTGCTDPDAPAKCRAIGTAYCQKVAEFCGNDAQPPPSVEDCENTYDEAVICDDALYLEDEEEDCLSGIDAIEECTFALPAACSGVVVVEEKAETESE